MSSKKFKRKGSCFLGILLALTFVFIPTTTLAINEIDNTPQTKKTTEATEEAKEVVSLVENSYNPPHIELSKYDRKKVERLVTGEAGVLGYEGCVLVAQAIRDSMVESNTTSINKIITDYKYSGSTKEKASDEAKEAVAYIFDKDGKAVNHRILYFYATNLVEGPWHETQNYITTCGNMKFFDKWE